MKIGRGLGLCPSQEDVSGFGGRFGILNKQSRCYKINCFYFTTR